MSGKNTAGASQPLESGFEAASQKEKDTEKIKAEARAYALSGGDHSNKTKGNNVAGNGNIIAKDDGNNQNQNDTTENNIIDEDEDYIRMIQSLGGGNNTNLSDPDNFSLFDTNMFDEDDGEFRLEDDSSSSGDEEEEIIEISKQNATPLIHNTQHSSPDPMDLLGQDTTSTNTRYYSNETSNDYDEDEELLHLLENDPNFFKDLEEELGSLLEEDLQAAERSLLVVDTANPSRSNSDDAKVSTVDQNMTLEKEDSKAKKKSDGEDPAPTDSKTAKPATKKEDDATSEPTENPIDLFSSHSKSQKNHHHPPPPQASAEQKQKLQELLQKHYQILIQQAILSIRSAQEIKSDATTTPSFFQSTETDMDLAEVLDLAVNMLQDLDQHRKDAIRTAIQLASSSTENDPDSNNDIEEEDDMEIGSPLQGRRSLFGDFEESTSRNSTSSNLPASPSHQEGGSKRLTRAAFQRLQELPSSTGNRRTAFDIPGLPRLKQTFSSIDKSVETVATASGGGNAKHKEDSKCSSNDSSSTDCNILTAPTHAQACRNVLKEAGAHINESLLPGTTDVSENFSSVQDCLSLKNDVEFIPPCTSDQELFLRKNRSLFTSAEDNLVLRGVNLYGEKQWLLISDRYLPDRSINIISQRYSKLCVMLYQARGVYIDDKGNLEKPPKLESLDDIDEARVKAAGLVKVEPPAILNVHRWSLEEDVALLKAVPIMGHMWAELGARLIPHRDRGHLRKRYQVLVRRVKATIGRDKKAASQIAAKGAGIVKGKKSLKKSVTMPAVVKPAETKPESTKPVSTKLSPKKTFGDPKAVTISTPTAKTVNMKKTPTVKPTAAKKSSPVKPTKAKTLPKSSVKTKPKAKASKASATKRSAKKTAAASRQAKEPTMSLEGAAATLLNVKPKEGNKETSSQVLPHQDPTGGTSAAANPYQMHPYYGMYPPAAMQQQQQQGAAWPYPRAAYQHGAYPYSYPQGAFPYPPYQGGGMGSAAMAAGAPYPPHQGNIMNLMTAPQGSVNPMTANTRAAPTAAATMPTQGKATARSNSNKDKPTKTLAGPVALKFTAPGPAASKPPSKSTKPMPSTNTGKPKPFVPFNRDADASRLAYEKLVDGTGEEEWSQMSGVKQLMANEEEKEAANAIVSQLAKSPGRSSNTLSQFPGGLDTTSNISGLSVLNESTRQAPDKTSGGNTSSANGPGIGLMAKVLANSTSQSSAQHGGEDVQPLPLAAAAAATTIGTPSRKTSSGSRGLYSPGFQSPTALLRAGAGLNTNMSFPHSPTNSTVMGIFDEEKSNTGGGGGGTGTGNEHSFLRDLQMPGDSMPPPQGVSGNTPTMQRQYSATSAGPGVGMNSNSMLIGTDDYEAVSALEALSNSPFQHGKKKSGSAKSSPEEESNRNSTAETAAAGGGARQSLFSKVIGGSRKKGDEKEAAEKPPKKKLKF